MINDLTFNTSYFKHVDDITALILLKNINDDILQACAERDTCIFLGDLT